MKSIGGVRPCDGSGTRHTGPNLADLYRRRRGRTSDVQSRKTRIQPRRLSVSRGVRSIMHHAFWCWSKMPKSSSASRRSSKTSGGRPIHPGQTCCTLQYSADGAPEASTAASSAVIGSMAAQIHHSWREGCGCALRLLRSMVPIFRSCLIEDDLMALTPHADGLVQFSI